MSKETEALHAFLDACKDTGMSGASMQEAMLALVLQSDEIKRLRIGHDRYETARRMNPRQWADAWILNTSTGKPFDEIVDNLRPFMVPNAELRGAIND